MKMCGKKNGFTLVELMLAAVGSAMLVLIVVLILFMSYREWRTNNDYAQLRRDTAFAVQLMAKEIRNSASIGGILTAENNRLILETNAAHPSYTTTFTRNASLRNLTYFRNTTSQGPLISTNLTVFNPQPMNNGVLLELVLVNPDGDLSITNKTFISTRNL
jgi:Tfp pilus assembly protein PilW